MRHQNDQTVPKNVGRVGGEAKTVQFVPLLVRERDAVTHDDLPAAPPPKEVSTGSELLQSFCGPTYKCYRKGYLKGPAATMPPAYRSTSLPAHQARFIIDTSDIGIGWALPYYYYLLDDGDPYYLYSYEGRYIYSFRHPGERLNALYMDGHVEAHQHYRKTGVRLWQWLYPDPS